jgi:hypothetical protein
MQLIEEEHKREEEEEPHHKGVRDLQASPGEKLLNKSVAPVIIPNDELME